MDALPILCDLERTGSVSRLAQFVSLLVRGAPGPGPATGGRATLTRVFGLQDEIVSVLQTVGVETFVRPLHLLRPSAGPELLVVVPESLTARQHGELSRQLGLEGLHPLSESSRFSTGTALQRSWTGPRSCYARSLMP